MSESSAIAVVRREDPATLDADMLLDEVSALAALYSGDGVQESFHVEDVTTMRSAFVVARTMEGEAIGCGALRRFSFEVAEFKGIYRRPEWPGVGSAILQYLEQLATLMGYRRVVVQTCAPNRRAVSFYLRHGYEPAELPGGHTAIGEVRCFSKSLPVMLGSEPEEKR
jgi:N-acetylglutamate synthase-like GNAT family acetyltransferase